MRAWFRSLVCKNAAKKHKRHIAGSKKIMTKAPPFTSIVQNLPSPVPFVPPEAIERRMGHPFKLRLGANESVFGISPLARQAMREAVDRVAWYNDPESYELRS